LLTLSRAFTESRVLLTAAELDLFTLLTAPKRLDEIVEKTGANGYGLEILLDALASMGLLQKAEVKWFTPAPVARWLSSESAESVLPMVLHNVNLWDRWSQLTHVVGGVAARQQAKERSLEAFIGAMHVVATPIASRIVELVEPGAARRMLDVGGASGTYTLAFLRASPQLHVTLFDRPPVIEMAKKLMVAEGMAERVTLAAGDFYTDVLPGGHDLALVSAIIHQNTPHKNVELFRKVYDSLEMGGRIVVRDHVLSEDRTSPMRGAMFAVNMLVAQNGGNSYTFAEIGDALEKAGFSKVRLIHPDTRMDGLVEAFKAAK
jgi:predicted O-methyltransferase YrrM